MSKRVLVTGFEPFGGEAVNAAWESVRTLGELSLINAEVHVRKLPTVFGESFDVLTAAIREVQPDIILCVGEAGGRSAMSLERIGVNLEHARIPDNAGNQPTELAIREDGPAAYWSLLPVADLVKHLQEAGIPAEESYTAGTYVCNSTLYRLIDFLTQENLLGSSVIGGFIHVPYLPVQAVAHKNAPSLSGEEVKRGLQLVIEYLV